MRALSLILIVTAATLLRAPASPQEKANPSPKEQFEESSKKVKELQKEQIATLKEMADQISTRYRSGHGSFDEVLEAKLMLHKAELDAAEKQSDRIALNKKLVDVMKEYEALADAQLKAARGTAAAVLKIKARRLEAEIQLEQAKAKEVKESK